MSEPERRKRAAQDYWPLAAAVLAIALAVWAVIAWRAYDLVTPPAPTLSPQTLANLDQRAAEAAAWSGECDLDPDALPSWDAFDERMAAIESHSRALTSAAAFHDPDALACIVDEYKDRADPPVLPASEVGLEIYCVDLRAALAAGLDAATELRAIESRLNADAVERCASSHAHDLELIAAWRRARDYPSGSIRAYRRLD